MSFFIAEKMSKNPKNKKRIITITLNGVFTAEYILGATTSAREYSIIKITNTMATIFLIGTMIYTFSYYQHLPESDPSPY